MPDDVEEASCWRSAFLKVVGLGWVDVTLPEVVVLLGKHAIVYAGEFAVDTEETRRLDACMGGCLGVEDPAVSVGHELISLE